MGDFELNLLDSLSDFVVTLFEWVGIAVLVWLGFLFLMAIVRDIQTSLTRPMRRAERTRMFLTILESILKQGLPLEETLLSLARSRDLSLTKKFHVVCDLMEKGLSLNEALEQVSDFIPASIIAMLRAGQKIGDLAKAMPACRHSLKDAKSQTLGAFNYLMISTIITVPLGFLMFSLLILFVLPKFSAIAEGFGNQSGLGLIDFLTSHLWLVIGLQAAGLLFTELFSYGFTGVPRLLANFPLWDRYYYLLPWQRRRMQRDFSTMLALLLDAGVPEITALTLAADCTANSAFRRRAARATNALQQGVKLADAVALLDDTGEFHWRLANAAVASGGFVRALTGWHDSLDARAFQQEQAAAQGVSTALVLWNGLFVGTFVAGVFMVLVSLDNAAILW